MDTSAHTLNTLFDQLGLASTDQDIHQFIQSHRGQSGLDPIDSAPFWTPSQSRFIQEAIREDSDWCEVVDDLSTRLHS